MRVVACPQCGTQVPWEGNPCRPFCSERCRLVDLGAWIDEKYSIPGPLDDESVAGEGAPAGPGRSEGHGRDDG